MKMLFGQIHCQLEKNWIIFNKLFLYAWLKKSWHRNWWWICIKLATQDGEKKIKRGAESAKYHILNETLYVYP